jgi:hypothetical protein
VPPKQGAKDDPADTSSKTYRLKPHLAPFSSRETVPIHTEDTFSRENKRQNTIWGEHSL